MSDHENISGWKAPAMLVASLLPAVVSASSFQILEQSPSYLGTAFAGTASAANDASTVYFNPAAMTRFEDARFTAGAAVIQPTAEFSNTGSVNALGQPLAGSPGETDKTGFVPNLYYTQPLGERMHFGIGVNAPFGLKSSYADDWVGRYHATESDLRVVNINPTIAYELTDTLSIGFGIDYQRMDATLENQVDSFAVCAGATGNPSGCSGGAFGVPLAPAAPGQDSSVRIEGDDAGYGVDFSLHYQPTARTRFGLLYRQGVEFDLEGPARFSQSQACAANVPCSGALTALEGPVRASVDLPDTVNLSASHWLTERWALHGDLAWTEWSSIRTVPIVNLESGATVSTLDLRYEDTMRYALGTSFEMSDAWTLRAGVAMDEAPQTDPRFQTPRIPDQDRTWAAAGFRYEFSERASIDAGYAHLFVDDIGINNVEQGNRLKGTFDADVDILAASLNWRF